MVLAGVGFAINNLGLLLTVLFLMGMQSTFFGPAKYAILPELLDDETLVGGNALVAMATFLAILLGTITGGLVVGAGYSAATSVVQLCELAAQATWTPTDRSVTCETPAWT